MVYCQESAFARGRRKITIYQLGENAKIQLNITSNCDCEVQCNESGLLNTAVKTIYRPQSHAFVGKGVADFGLEFINHDLQASGLKYTQYLLILVYDANVSMYQIVNVKFPPICQMVLVFYLGRSDW
ncbi:hypothetical protein CFIMG_007581RA00001 [Ceratocystis fimbriata CBS 114723]|uniref:Uncharacterized protein n=1 Tax=Ceratocystis fimbriata CBS 114723 TaxID=1035309 RepID=A0A2C5XE82_9PEZI|nr:hypothetical protein CFIMG_007581RA00001 [Ceratocystis fimbriata CBS 114723]